MKFDVYRIFVELMFSSKIYYDVWSFIDFLTLNINYGLSQSGSYLL